MWEYEYHPGKVESEFNIMSAKIIQRYIDIPERIIELGAGTGELSFKLKRNGIFLYLVDKSESAIKYIKDYYTDKGLVQYIDYVLANIDILSGDRGEDFFDLVVSSGLIEHYKGDDLKKLCRIHKELSSKYVVCIVPNATPENIALSKTERNIQQYGYEKPMNMEELDYMFVDDQFKKIHGQTFYKNGKLLIGVYER